MAAPFRVKAIYEYSSPHEDDLNFPAGQIITVTAQEDADWYAGEYVDDDGLKKDGIFPCNFVEKHEPTAPPRPSRTRTKKDEDLAPLSPAIPAPEDAAGAVKQPPHPDADEPPPMTSPVDRLSPTTPFSPPPPKPADSAPAPTPAPAPTATDSHAPPAPAAAAPKPKPAAPPPVSDKPTGNSFKDRIAAFNKPAAPPVAPFKPGGLGSAGFVKKPFVAPPPSRNAYVPPPRETPSTPSYRRDEDPEIREREASNLEQAEKAGLLPTAQPHDAAPEDQPKPTSLKERIALLQKQQMEQAQRHADAAAKKEKPRKPPKKRSEPTAPPPDAAAAAAPDPQPPASAEHREADETGTRTSTDEAHPARAPAAARRKSWKGPAAEAVHDGNDADMSGAGDTTEGHDDTTERDDSDGISRRVARVQTASTAASVKTEGDNEEVAGQEGEEEEEEEEEEEDVDPEVRRKEELRARMAKMSGGMGFHGMFGAPMPSPGAPALPRKKAPKAEAEAAEQTSPVSRAAPPIPTPMALPGMGGARASEETKRGGEDDSPVSSRAKPPPLPTRAQDDELPEDDEEEDQATTPAPLPEPTKTTPRREVSGPPPVPGGRPAPPPVPSENRPPPPPPSADLKSATDGSESDDELSAGARERAAASGSAMPRSPPMLPQPLQSPGSSAKSPPLSPRAGESSPLSPSAATNKRNSRPPPPIPGSAPVPPPAHGRPPPPPPPHSAGLSREPNADAPPVPSRPPQAGEEENEENTEYEGDYDTDIASSVPHKDALKAHARDSSLEDNGPQSPVAAAPPTLPPPIPAAAAPRAVPPPIPTQPPPESGARRSMDAPRAAPPPPPPPPAKEALSPRMDDEGDAYGHSAQAGGGGGFGSGYGHSKTPKIDEEAEAAASSPTERRAPPAAAAALGRAGPRQSTDMPRSSLSGRRSADMHRPSMESGFIANDIDLAVQSGWWKQAKQVPPVLQGRRDIHFECDESTTTNRGAKTTITRVVTVLYQDYSQTVLTARYDPYNVSDVELEQRHEAPPRALRQDQMEEYHEQFGRRLAEAAASRKDTVVGDGTPRGLVLELLRPLKGALWPVGTRSYGALVYSNMANASTQQHDAIRPGDIMSIRNAKFQGKHGPMHAKYSAEVGKPDHVAVVAEWDGTKKKVRAWEQGRESKKVKMESFKLDDLRSGEVKIWRVMPRSWLGWDSQP